MFHGIEKAYTDAMIKASCWARQALLETSISDAVSKSHVRRKGDTLGLDQRPENAIVSALERFDQYCIIITEERGAVNPFLLQRQVSLEGDRTFFVCDPFDRSNQACEFFTKYGKSDERVIDVIRRKGILKKWEREYSLPASITSSTSAISCVRRGMPIAAVIYNHFTEEMTVACPGGIYHVKLPKNLSEAVDLDYVQERGRRVLFPQPDYNGRQKIVTFNGKPDRGYPENFNRCELVTETSLKHHLHYHLPGGPSRVLYLSDLQLPKMPIGVVVANGEKLGEWTHWLPFVRFARRIDDDSACALRLFEVSQSQSLMIDGSLMMPSQDYSIFVRNGDARTMIVSSQKLQSFENPSRYRSTLILIRASNKWALNQVEQFGYREIMF